MNSNGRNGNNGQLEVLPPLTRKEIELLLKLLPLMRRLKLTAERDKRDKSVQIKVNRYGHFGLVELVERGYIGDT